MLSYYWNEQAKVDTVPVFSGLITPDRTESTGVFATHMLFPKFCIQFLLDIIL